MVNHHLGAVELFAYVFVGLGGVVILSAFDIGESREAQYGHEPQQHYDNLAAHGQEVRCLHCKYNNNVHTRKENWQKMMTGGEYSMMQPAEAKATHPRHGNHNLYRDSTPSYTNLFQCA